MDCHLGRSAIAKSAVWTIDPPGGCAGTTMGCGIARAMYGWTAMPTTSARIVAPTAMRTQPNRVWRFHHGPTGAGAAGSTDRGLSTAARAARAASASSASAALCASVARRDSPRAPSSRPAIASTIAFIRRSCAPPRALFASAWRVQTIPHGKPHHPTSAEITLYSIARIRRQLAQRTAAPPRRKLMAMRLTTYQKDARRRVGSTRPHRADAIDEAAIAMRVG